MYIRVNSRRTDECTWTRGEQKNSKRETHSSKLESHYCNDSLLAIAVSAIPALFESEPPVGPYRRLLNSVLVVVRLCIILSPSSSRRLIASSPCRLAASPCRLAASSPRRCRA